jgi:hypothetical protein
MDVPGAPEAPPDATWSTTGQPYAWVPSLIGGAVVVAVLWVPTFVLSGSWVVLMIVAPCIGFLVVWGCLPNQYRFRISITPDSVIYAEAKKTQTFRRADVIAVIVTPSTEGGGGPFLMVRGEDGTKHSVQLRDVRWPVRDLAEHLDVPYRGPQGGFDLTWFLSYVAVFSVVIGACGAIFAFTQGWTAAGIAALVAAAAAFAWYWHRFQHWTRQLPS